MAPAERISASLVSNGSQDLHSVHLCALFRIIPNPQKRLPFREAFFLLICLFFFALKGLVKVGNSRNIRYRKGERDARTLAVQTHLAGNRLHNAKS